MDCPTVSNTSTHKVVSLYDVLMTVQPVDAPAPPKEVTDFRLLPRVQRFKAVKTGGTVESNFYAQESVVEYLEQKWIAELKNRDLFLGLRQLYQAEGDPGRKALIEARIMLVQKKISAQSYKFRALSLNWGKYPLTADKPVDTGAQRTEGIQWDA